MKIKTITPLSYEIVETDDEDPDYSTYIRIDANTWKVIMGESWEPVYPDFDTDEIEIEKEYQEFKKA